MTSRFPRLVASLASIKTRLMLGAAAAIAVSIALTTLVLVGEAERETLSQQREREMREGVRTASVLSHRVIDLQRALAATARLLDPQTLADGQKLRLFIESKPVLRGMFSNVFAAAVDGRMLILADADGPRQPDLNISDRDYFRRTLAEQRSIVSEPLPGRVSNEPVIIFTTPLRNAAGVYGVIGGALRLKSRDLLDDLVDESETSGDTLVVVTDAHGRILAHPSHDQIMQSISMEPRMADGFAAWLAEGGASGGAIEPSGLFLPQSGQVLGVAGVAGPDWLVWRAVPERRLLAPLHEARRKAMTFAAGIVCVASVLMLAIISWLLRPLSQLKERAAHLFDGRDDIHEGWPDHGGEIGDLARVLRHVGAERSQLEQFNAQVLAKLGSVMAAAPLGIVFTKAQRFELVSAEMCRLIGLSADRLLGQPAAMIFAATDDYAALGPQVATAFANGVAYAGDWKFVRAGGDTFWGQLRGLPVESGNPEAGTIWTLADITDQVATREALEWSAHHDTLTGLANRKLFEQRIAAAVHGRGGAGPAAIIMVDLDRFKPINDTAGHAAGDAMLKTVAKAIAGCVRSVDLVARLGGDEFALLLENCPRQAAMRIANNVHRAISGGVLHFEGRQLQVGASLGVSVLSLTTADANAWLQEADAACYEAKAAGRGVVRTAGGQLLRVVQGADASA